MDGTKNGKNEGHSKFGLTRSESPSQSEMAEEGNNTDEDAISLYAHSDYELESEEINERKVAFSSKYVDFGVINSADEDSLKVTGSPVRNDLKVARGLGTKFERMKRFPALSKQSPAIRSGGRRFSRGRKKWTKRRGVPDGFGHNSQRNPPNHNPQGNKGFLRRPVFSKYSESNYTTHFMSTKRGILGDAPPRHCSATQYSSKSCLMDANFHSYNRQSAIEEMILSDKRQMVLSHQQLWRQTDDDEWYDDPQNENANRQRRFHRETSHHRRPSYRWRGRNATGVAPPTNQSSYETSEEGNESPKLENVNEREVSLPCGLPSSGIDNCDTRHVIIDRCASANASSNKEASSADPSSFQSKLSLVSLPENETHRSSLLPTPDVNSLPEYAPPAKKRAALLPTPDERAGSAKLEVKVSEDLKPVEDALIAKSSTEERTKVLSPVRRPPEKTATVAPLQKSTSLSDLALDDGASRQLVTPPIEVSHIVDAPPRPPNPGPMYAISSNSNSPAASRPSSRSGRFAGYEPTRAATPDVPPRPVNPPPPVCAPSPASTPEGMPPRPQNPGPPLDVSLSTMARGVSSTNGSAVAFHHAAVSSCTRGLLPLPAHSKLPSTGQHAAPGMEPSPAHSSVSRIAMLHGRTPTTTCVSSAADETKTLLADKEADKLSDSDEEDEEQKQQLLIAGYTGPDSTQTTVMDLSKSTLIQRDDDASHDEGDGRKEANSILPTPESLISKTQPRRTSGYASLSFSTTVVSSSFPISSYLSCASKTVKPSKSALLPSPEDKSASLNDSQTAESAGDEADSAQETSESAFKERIIDCLREKQYLEGIGALKEALTKMPDKFGDADVYEVIEYFGQNDAYEHVVAAARMTRSPDQRLLQFFEHMAEEVPDVLKEAREDVWLIYSEVLARNANITVIDSCIRCFAALECWDKVWTTLQLHPNSSSLPPLTVTLCLRALAGGQADKHLNSAGVFLSSLTAATKRALDIDVLNAVWLRCAELGLTQTFRSVDSVLKMVPHRTEDTARHDSQIRAFLMEHLIAGHMETLSNFVLCVGPQPCQQYLDYFVAGFMVSEGPVHQVLTFVKQLRQRGAIQPGPRCNDAFVAGLCVRFMRHLTHRQVWSDAFELWRLISELGIACERLAVSESESQTSIALLVLEVCVRHGRYDTAVSMLSESLVLGQPWSDPDQIRKRVALLQEIFERSIDTVIESAAAAFKALLSTKDTDQAIIPDYGRLVDLMTVYNNYLVAACHHGSRELFIAALDLVAIAHQKQLLVKPTVLRYLVVACVRFKLHNKVKEFLQRGMTVSIYPTIDVHSNMLLLPTDLATEEVAALLLLYLMLLKEYLVQALHASRVGGDQNAVDVLQACSMTVVPNNVSLRDREFTERFQLVSTEYGLLQRVQAILASGGNSGESTGYPVVRPVDYLKSPISADLTFEGGRSVLKLNTSEVYNNVYYIEPPSE